MKKIANGKLETGNLVNILGMVYLYLKWDLGVIGKNLLKPKIILFRQDTILLI